MAPTSHSPSNGPRRRVLLLGVLVLVLSAPAILAQTNLALKKPAVQSSTWSAAYPAASCVDGIKGGGSVCATELDANPWWQVDLQGNYVLSEIVVYNRTDCCAERSRTLTALLSSDGQNWSRIYTHDGSDFKTLRISAGGRTARYVRLQQASTDYMNLDEVEVYGAGSAVPNPPPTPQPSPNLDGAPPDFSGTWSFYANGYKGELYLKQNGAQIQGWMGVNGVNFWADVVTGTVTGNGIRFTRTNSALTRPQEYRGFMLLHDNPQIDPRFRMTGVDALAGIFSHLGEWSFGWYATRLGPYREEPPR